VNPTNGIAVVDRSSVTLLLVCPAPHCDWRALRWHDADEAQVRRAMLDHFRHDHGSEMRVLRETQRRWLARREHDHD
jgi:hypothetical protein